MQLKRLFPAGVFVVVVCVFFPMAAAGHGYHFPRVEIVATPSDGGIREEVPAKYRERFERWKAELLSTAFGRQQWERYANNRSFVLTIRVAEKKGKGGGTDRFQWDEQGNFVGATITLGHRIEEGYPNPIYYPVLNSLSADHTSFSISGRILAASKFSHELGHVAQTEEANVELIRKQSKLIPEYTSIFLKNGHNTKDRKLIALAEELGGTPIEIWESREYWSEVAAMNYLKERLRDESFYCYVFNKIRSNVQTYAREYTPRFSPDPPGNCK